MRCILTLLFLALLAGCDGKRPPRLALLQDPPAPIDPPPKAEAATPLTASPPPEPKSKARLYSGKTIAEWSEGLHSHDRVVIMEACRALKVMGPEGRPHLFRGLEHRQAETRRMCLHCLTADDFQREGEMGRQRLLKLAGDREDVRIRERAVSLLTHWHGNAEIP